MRGILFITITLMLGIACNKVEDIPPFIPPIQDSSYTDTATNHVDTTSIYRQIVDSQTLIAHPGLTNSKKYITYLIKKGNNYCEGNNFILSQYRSLQFKAILDSSCIYQTVLPSNQEDINKLYGFSDCTSHHHTNSARFGWNWDKGALRIHAYCYADSIRRYREIGIVKVNEEFDCQLTVLPHQYIFSLNGDTVMMDRGCTDNIASGYILYPYFGGDEPAPHDISVQIKEY